MNTTSNNQQRLKVGRRRIVFFLSAVAAAFTFIVKQLTPLTDQQIGHTNNILQNVNDANYLNWLYYERMETIPFPITMNCRCTNGLGHQLTRLSAAYHLAMLYKIPRIYPSSNPLCGGNIFSIHNSLLGPYEIDSEMGAPLLVDLPFSDENIFRNHTLFKLPTSFPNLTVVPPVGKQVLRQTVDITNEVVGYANLFTTTSLDGIIENEYWGKDRSDYQMYSQFMDLFRRTHSDRIKMVMQQTNFQHHTVFGLHIRAGNGETGDFVNKGRGINDLENWLISVAQVLCDYEKQNSRFFRDNPLMVFVSTDTASIIQKLQSISNAKCKIPYVSADQAYPEEGVGVSFLAYSGNHTDQEKCLNGWRDMALDMYMLTQCNTVIAGTYSSFTQTAPLSFVLHKAQLYNHGMTTESSTAHPHYFCEFGIAGDRMDCFDSLSNWIKKESTIVTGNASAARQKRRMEVKFPVDHDSSSTVSLGRFFKGTALNPPIPSGLARTPPIQRPSI